MKEITRIEKVYDFNELSDTAKQKAKQAYLDDFREPFMFTDIVESDMKYSLFPNSDMQVQYSLSSCQGDGLNVYGKLNIKDAVKVYRKYVSDISAKENRLLNFFEKLDIEIKLDDNRHYCYFTDKTEDIRYYIEDELENDYYRDIPYDFIGKFAEEVNEGLRKYCKYWEDEGYDFFYEVDEEEINETWEINEYEGFYENGTPCYV